MQRRCPECKSSNVRRTYREPEDLATQPHFRSPYRCRDCRTKFWAMGTTVYRRIVVAVALNLAFFTVIAGIVVLFVD